MEMNPGALPRPGRMPAQEFWSPETWWRWRRRSELRLEKKGPESGFPRRGVNICQRGASAEVRGAQAPPPARPGVGPAPRVPGAPVAPLWPYFYRTEASGALIFYIFFPDFFWQFK